MQAGCDRGLHDSLREGVIEASDVGETVGASVPVRSRSLRSKIARAIANKRQAMAYFAGTMIYFACNWANSIALAKMGMKSDVGYYALGVAVTQPIFSFLQFNLRALLVTDSRHEHPFSIYLKQRCLCCVVALVVLLLTVRFGRYGSVAAGAILVTGIGVVVDSLSDIIYGRTQQKSGLWMAACSFAAKGVLTLSLLALFFRLTHNVIFGIAGSSLASLIVLTLYDIPQCVRTLDDGRRRPGWLLRAWQYIVPTAADRDAMLRLTWLALPMGVTLVLSSLNTNMGRYFVERRLGTSTLGVYAALSSLPIAGRVLVLALGQAASPRLAKAYAAGDRKSYLSTAAQLLAVAAGLGVAAPVVAQLIGRQVLSLVFTRDYAQNLDALIVILVGGGFVYMANIIGYAVTAARWFRIQAVWFGASLLANLAISAWAIPRYGLMGAAYAFMISGAVQCVFGLVLLTRAAVSVKAPESNASARPGAL